MLYLVIAFSVACVIFFMWTGSQARKREDKAGDAGKKKTFRSEEDLEEYGKPLKDGKNSPDVDFEDAE